MATDVVPTDSRYVPFVQQPYCCGPACLQMVLYKNNLPLVSQEQIGAELGLVIPPEAKDAFFNADVRDKPVVGSGYGTRIQDSEFGLDKLIEKQNWPFNFSVELASAFPDETSFIARLKELVAADTDVLVCFQNDHGTGHICVLDIVGSDTVRVMDPAQSYPKWRSMSYADIYGRVKAHGDDNYGGIWILVKK
jgi:hypothetical protein